MNRFLKTILIIPFLFFGMKTPSFSAFVDKMYCDITKDKIVISLENKGLYSCQTYIKYIELQMKKVYKDLALIKKYIEKKSDLGYWRSLRDDKIKLLDLYQNIRLNILFNMQNFEMNMVDVSKQFFLDEIAVYNKKIKKTILSLVNLQDSKASRLISLLEQQNATIEKIEESVTVDQLSSYIKRYVYLKQQIEGK